MFPFDNTQSAILSEITIPFKTSEARRASLVQIFSHPLFSPSGRQIDSGEGDPFRESLPARRDPIHPRRMGSILEVDESLSGCVCVPRTASLSLTLSRVRLSRLG
ncbi:hypothetical protein CEXT_552881 [Caerostris extrusa]|uniref:Uncharacterized protein n=1 Tax=Caerostris extrusa TaxID=172846 RepID=A0AAV4NBD3_CAEEX|nr:hypothetical protein CEXT_552881 [Caerostris extrusa]